MTDDKENSNDIEAEAMKNSYGEENSDDDDDNENELKSTNNLEETREDPSKSKSIFVRHAESMARRSFLHLLMALVLSIVISVIGFVVGGFSVSVDNAGWVSRGTLISNRQSQMTLIEIHQADLFYDEDGDLWEELQTKIQPGWEADDDDETNTNRRRELMPGNGKNSKNRSFADLLAMKISGSPDYRYDLSIFSHPRIEGRGLQNFDEIAESRLGQCQVDWYGSDSMLYDSNVVSVWKTDPGKKTSSISALDPDVLFEICEAESNTLNELQSRGLCFGCPDGKCLPPYSLVLMARTYIEGSFDMDCRALIDAYTLEVQEEMRTDLINCVEDINENYNAGDPDSSGITQCSAGFVPTVLDSQFGASNPIVRYTSSYFPTGAKNVDQIYDIVGKLDRGDKDLVKGAYDTPDEDFLITLVDDLLLADMILAMASAVVTTLAMIIHTKSPWITSIGLLQIILSFPLAFTVYTFVAQIEFFPFLNFIGIFVVFALGADDVFVAVDKWKNTRLGNPAGTTVEIAAVALPEAAYAMLLTSATTSAAFFATAVCPVAPLTCFAVFCGLLIIFDYVMNMFLVFPALCLYDKWLLSKRASCCTAIDRKKILQNVADGAIAVSKHKGKKANDEPDEMDGEEEGTKDGLNPSLIHRVLAVYYDGLHKIRWLVFVACLASMILSSIYASRIELPASIDVPLVRQSIQFEQNRLWRQNLMFDALQDGGGSATYVVWGVKARDTGDQLDPDSFTTLELDDKFVARSADSQTYLANFCDRLFATEFASLPYLDYQCPINSFDDWLKEQAALDEPDDAYAVNCGGATSIPVPEGIFDSCIIAWSQQAEDFSVLAEQGEVKIIIFTSLSSIRFDSSQAELRGEWNKFEKWLHEERKVAPSGANHMYHTSEDFWWYDTNGSMLDTARVATSMALAFAAVVILISSRSIILTLFAVISIGYVLAAAIASVVGIGWKLGFLEAICFAILIGISCDFVIHFSHAYAHHPGVLSRHERTKYALIHMGPSILAAAATTFAAAVVMVFTQITFFQKFAVILFMTILHSTIGSFVVFITLADCIGPANPTLLLDILSKKCCNKKKE